MTSIKTNETIKNFFSNNWLSLAILVGLVIGVYFVVQRFKEVSDKNDLIQTLVNEHRDALTRKDEQIRQITGTYETQQRQIEALRADYEERMGQLRREYDEHITNINRRRNQRVSELTNNPDELANQFGSVFGMRERNE